MGRKSISDKRLEYKQVFENEAGKKVLADLRVFCHATKTTYSDNPYELYRYEGRREVFLQIMNILKVDFEDYYEYEPDDLI